MLLFLIGTNSINALQQKTLSCMLSGEKDNLSFVIPSQRGDLPKIDFPYPITSTLFHFSSENLLLVAMDSDESSRLRLFISAQYHKNHHAFEGQFMTDYGGNQIQLDNGPVTCKTHVKTNGGMIK
jgi:hypothetical protein